MNLRKAKQAYMVRCEEDDKAKTAARRAEEEGAGSTAKSVEKKKRLEEEARNKVFLTNRFFYFCVFAFRAFHCGEKNDNNLHVSSFKSKTLLFRKM